MDKISGIEPTKFNVVSNKYLLEAKRKLGIDKLPKNINLSTLVMNCDLGTNIYRLNIGKYIALSSDGIIGVRYDVIPRKPPKYRGLVPMKKKGVRNGKKGIAKPKKTAIRNFFNQVTILMRSKYKASGKPVNVKLFRNGNVHLTGVSSVECFFDIMARLVKELKKKKIVIKKVIDKETKGNKTVVKEKRVIKPFVEDISSLKIKNIKIRMINTNFKIKYEIDRDQLYEKLCKESKKHIGEITHDPESHASVDLKYKYRLKDDEKAKSKKQYKNVSIFIFETGAVIITGSSTCDQVLKAYKFIVKKIYEYGNDIKLHKLDIKKIQKIEAKLLEKQKKEKKNNTSDSENESELEQSDDDDKKKKKILSIEESDESDDDNDKINLIKSLLKENKKGTKKKKSDSDSDSSEESDDSDESD